MTYELILDTLLIWLTNISYLNKITMQNKIYIKVLGDFIYSVNISKKNIIPFISQWEMTMKSMSIPLSLLIGLIQKIILLEHNWKIFCCSFILFYVVFLKSRNLIRQYRDGTVLLDDTSFPFDWQKWIKYFIKMIFNRL